jgi:hypothetical protein
MKKVIDFQLIRRDLGVSQRYFAYSAAQQHHDIALHNHEMVTYEVVYDLMIVIHEQLHGDNQYNESSYNSPRLTTE